MSEENYDVTGVGQDVWGRFCHRGLKIERCENGYIVKYKVPDESNSEFNVTTEKTRVFTNNMDMTEFVKKYFDGCPPV